MLTNRRRRAATLVTLLLGLLIASALPAEAKEGGDEDNLVVLQGRAVVTPEDSYDNVVVFDGGATVDGSARGDVVVFNGDATINGTVGENVVAFNGVVTVTAEAVIGGDLVTRKEPVIEEGATIRGEIKRRPFDLYRDPFFFIARFVFWLAVSVSILALGLLMIWLTPRAADAMAATWAGSRGPVVGWGLLMLIGLPIATILTFVTVVGIPFGFGVLSAHALIYSTGYMVGAWILGRSLVKAPRSRFLALLAGVAIVRGLSLIPFVAGIVGFIATVVGLGAIAIAIWRARRGPATSPPAEPVTAAAAA